MKSLPFTLATYHVKPGFEDVFIERWQLLADTFSDLGSPPFWGTLIRSKTNPNLFHSFGPWEKPEDVAAMRSSEKANAAFGAIHDVCDELAPDDYDVVLHVRVRPGGDA